jgi:predicted DsbA family dithiol-disulfide isomerase
MEIEIWSDITCPFCYIGKRNFQIALEQFSEKENLKVRWRSFELDANAVKEYPGTLYDWLSKRYGRTTEQVIEMNQPVIRQASSLGLDFHLENVRPTNSFDAHRLIHLSREYGKELEMAEVLFRAYFSEGKNISNDEVLVQSGMSIGLTKNEIESTLHSERFADAVRIDKNEAQKFSIRGVPYFLLNRSAYLSGAQPAHVFLEALKKQKA